MATLKPGKGCSDSCWLLCSANSISQSNCIYYYCHSVNKASKQILSSGKVSQVSTRRLWNSEMWLGDGEDQTSAIPCDSGLVPSPAVLLAQFQDKCTLWGRSSCYKGRNSSLWMHQDVGITEKSEIWIIALQIHLFTTSATTVLW